MTKHQACPWLSVLIPTTLLLSACGGGGNGGVAVAPATATTNPGVYLSVSNPTNQIPLTVEQVPTINTFNIPYVTVTVCHPTNGQCLAIDHVVVDTGSYGLRLLSDFPGISALGLPSVTTTTSQPVSECAQFLEGTLWGGVYQAKVKLAQEVTNTIPIQLISDPGNPNVVQAPTSCTSSANNIGTQSGIGGNGLLGVGMFPYDLSPYYSCTGSGSTALCTTIASPTNAIEIANPVAAFTSHDNNGVILQMPSIGPHGAVSATGILTFGIDSQADNQLTALGLTPVATDPTTGNFSATLTGQTTYPASFFDSGSNFNYIPLSGIATDNLGNYVPPSLITESGTAGNVPLSFDILDISADLNAGNEAFNDNGNNGGGITTPGGAASADFGLPYYFGHSIAHVMAGQTVTEGTGPFYAIK